MSDDDLDAVLRWAADPTMGDEVRREVPALVAEVRRLRGTVGSRQDGVSAEWRGPHAPAPTVLTAHRLPTPESAPGGGLTEVGSYAETWLTRQLRTELAPEALAVLGIPPEAPAPRDMEFAGPVPWPFPPVADAPTVVE